MSNTEIKRLEAQAELRDRNLDIMREYNTQMAALQEIRGQYNKTMEGLRVLQDYRDLLEATKDRKLALSGELYELAIDSEKRQ
jgi:hypothetical protein